jgi:chorismate mutase
MKPQHKNIIEPISSALDVLRREIDGIDDQILDLLEQRYALVKRVARAKARAEQALAVRPEREASIVQRLSARAVHVPAADVAGIWRSIPALSAYHQRAHAILVSGPAPARLALMTLAAKRYGAGVPIRWVEDRGEAMGQALRGEAIWMVPAHWQRGTDARELDLLGLHPTGCVEHPWAAELGRIGCDEEDRHSRRPLPQPVTESRIVPLHPAAAAPECRS